jgi:hypothetical protein
LLITGRHRERQKYWGVPGLPDKLRPLPCTEKAIIKKPAKNLGIFLLSSVTGSVTGARLLLDKNTFLGKAARGVPPLTSIESDRVKRKNLAFSLFSFKTINFYQESFDDVKSI